MQAGLDLPRRPDQGFMRITVDVNVRPNVALRGCSSPGDRRAVIGQAGGPAACVGFPVA